MDTDVREYQAALNTLKTAAAPFLALSKLYDAAAPLLAVVNHEAELKAAIESLKADVAGWESKVSEARATEETATADARAEHEKFVAEYAAHRDKLRAEALAAEADRDSRVADAKAIVEDVSRKSIAEIDAVRAKADAERQTTTDELAAYTQAAIAERARIKTEIAVFQTHLDDLKAKVSAALA
jgi:hypothetical protein